MNVSGWWQEKYKGKPNREEACQKKDNRPRLLRNLRDVREINVFGWWQEEYMGTPKGNEACQKKITVYGY